MLRNARRLALLAAVLVVTSFGTTRAAEKTEALLATSFETPPTLAGWWRGAYPFEKLDAAWIDSTSADGRHALEVRAGWWAGPRMEVKPLGYYRLRFRSTVEGKGYWMTQFYDGQGQLLDADHYSSIYPSDEWQQHEFCFRARLGAATAEVRFRAMSAPIYVDDVVVEPISRPEVARWADRVYAAMPPVDVAAVPRAGRYLRRTIDKLRRGETLRIVMLGDSVANDTGNSAYDVLIERMYPGAQVELITSVRGGTGCTYYREENRVKPYVLDYEPDLLLIAGISHGHDVEAVRSVIRQVRAVEDPDVLILSGAISPPIDLETAFRHLPEPQRREQIRQVEGYRPGLARLARQEKVEYLDMRHFWDAYVEEIRRHPMWLRRDHVHANARGRQVLARVLEAYFAP
jgi:hypothetical protein